MALARDNLDLISQDPEARRLASEREEQLAVYRMTLAASRAEGKIEVLLELLGQRFGLVPMEVRDRVQRATHRQLDAWVRRVLRAASIDEVLAA